MEPDAMRATAVRALFELRARTVLQIVVCVSAAAWALLLTRALAGLVVVAPPVAFAIAVALGREQAIRRGYAAARGPAEQLEFLTGFVEQLLARRRRLRFAGIVWGIALWVFVRQADFDDVPEVRVGLLAVTAALVASSAYAFASVPRLARLRAALREAYKGGSTAALVVLSLVTLATLAGCPAQEDATPCFPSVASDDVPWVSHRDLGWEIDAMGTIAEAPKTTDPPSDVFARAERDLQTEFYVDAAKGLLAVERGDTHDGRGIRQIAQYQLAIVLYRMKYYAEARRIFRLVAKTKDHPRMGEAEDWEKRRACGG